MNNTELKQAFEAVRAELIEDGIGFRLYWTEWEGIRYNVFIDVKGDYSVSLDNHATVNDEDLPEEITHFASAVTSYLHRYAEV